MKEGDSLHHVSVSTWVLVEVGMDERVLEQRRNFCAGTPLSMNIDIPVATWLMYVWYCAFGRVSTPFKTHVTNVAETANELQMDVWEP